jgi:hypothetical protein
LRAKKVEKNCTIRHFTGNLENEMPESIHIYFFWPNVLTTGLVKTPETNTEVLTTGLVKNPRPNTEVLTTGLAKTPWTNTEIPESVSGTGNDYFRFC